MKCVILLAFFLTVFNLTFTEYTDHANDLAILINKDNLHLYSTSLS